VTYSYTTDKCRIICSYGCLSVNAKFCLGFYGVSLFPGPYSLTHQQHGLADAYFITETFYETLLQAWPYATYLFYSFKSLNLKKSKYPFTVDTLNSSPLGQFLCNRPSVCLQQVRSPSPPPADLYCQRFPYKPT
jgi:hypothetical protein